MFHSKQKQNPLELNDAEPAQEIDLELCGAAEQVAGFNSGLGYFV